MSVGKQIMASSKARLLAGALMVFVAWQGWLSLSAPGKIAPELQGKPRLNVVVTLPFPPERFHVLTFQRYGRVTGTEDNAVELRSVKREDLTSIARKYWVRRIDPMNEGD